MNDATTSEAKMTIGLDLGDRHIQVCLVDEAGEVIEEARLATRPQALRRRFCGADQLRIVLEAGTHSPWVSRLLAELGHEVIVANPRKLRLIYTNDSKSDRVDAEYLARVGRLDPTLLAPLRHRGAETQVDLALLRSRNALVRARTRLISHARGTTKSLGARLPACSSESFAAKAGACLPDELRPALDPVLAVIAGRTFPHDGGGPRTAFSPASAAPRATSRLKELYRALVRRLHPDTQQEMTAQKIEWWHQAQAAYEHGDEGQLEIILTLCEIGETGTTAHTSASLLQRITAQLKTSLREIKRQLAERRRDPAWGFSGQPDHEGLAVRLRHAMTSDLERMRALWRETQELIAGWKAAAERLRTPRRRKRREPDMDVPF